MRLTIEKQVQIVFTTFLDKPKLAFSHTTLRYIYESRYKPVAEFHARQYANDNIFPAKIRDLYIHVKYAVYE